MLPQALLLLFESDMPSGHRQHYPFSLCSFATGQQVSLAVVHLSLAMPLLTAYDHTQSLLANSDLQLLNGNTTPAAMLRRTAADP